MASISALFESISSFPAGVCLAAAGSRVNFLRAMREGETLRGLQVTRRPGTGQSRLPGHPSLFTY